MHTTVPPNAKVFVDPLSSLLLCVPQSRKVNDSDPEIACLFGGFDLHANLRNFFDHSPSSENGRRAQPRFSPLLRMLDR